MTDPSESDRRERILRERADRLALTPTTAERELVVEVAIVLVGDDQVGVPVRYLREIVRVPPITPLPGLPEGLVGVALVRGEILSVIDLALWVGAKASKQRSCLVVLDGPSGPLGALVDKSLGFRSIYADELATDLDVSAGSDRSCVSRRTRDLCAILDTGKLLSDPRICVGAARPERDAGDPRDPPPNPRGQTP